ncbi:hypothetical protein O6H91_05G042700 [Diphasiastrum complanatum]|uniref:Uncharacterized protein n=2 Tax=Diphasiastrum complanatum TaxID=34168 RepID=A0ACC2DMX2_DIPCM|nr:hypothetical protein O6H91_05G042700 [Diphasiastrum complanatum]KAJ7555520.1 hypothetical protein O6H91_05G042700 [Diphasiastrum complanatum]
MRDQRKVRLSNSTNNISKTPVEALFGEKMGDQIEELPSKSKNNISKTPVVQKLYDICKSSFTSPEKHPAKTAVERVRGVIEKISCRDLGLTEIALQQHARGFGFFGANGHGGQHSTMLARWTPPISYLHIYESDNFSMGIFCLPTLAVIPLHNHPGMTVFSKLLYGSMHVKAYDWLNPVDEGADLSSKPRLAKLVTDRVFTAPCEVSILYPTSDGNIHAFTAVTPCAVLDVLAPSYSPKDGRNCSYYREFPYSSISGGPFSLEQNVGADTDDPKLVWLEEFQPPDDFVIRQGTYQGPIVVP